MEASWVPAWPPKPESDPLPTHHLPGFPGKVGEGQIPPGVPVWLHEVEGKGWGGSVLLLCTGLGTRHLGQGIPQAVHGQEVAAFMQEGSSGRSSQSRHDGEKGKRQEETGEARRVRKCPSAGSWDWGWGRNGPRPSQVQAAGIGDCEGRNPSVLRSKLLIKHFTQLCPFPFEKSLRSRYSQPQPHSLGRVLQPD